MTGTDAASDTRGDALLDILVIDDDDMMLEIIADMLGDAGYTVRTALDGQSGLDALAQSAPALIVLDLNMPVMTGYEVARRVRADPRCSRIPILAASGDGSDAGRDAALAAGCSAMLTKPLDATALVARVRELLG